MNNQIKPTLQKCSVFEIADEIKLMQENTTKLKAVIDEWLKVLKDGNKKYAEFQEARKHFG